MKTFFLVAAITSQLFTISLSAKHLLLETVDKKNDSVSSPPPPANNSKTKAGFDYGLISNLLEKLPKLPNFLPLADDDDDDAGLEPTRVASCYGGSSRHGAPCTT